jgi:DNA-binding transcriptional LysR family regulator
MDQSNVSRKIIALEVRLGIKLFKRLARGLILTKHGEILLEEVKDILLKIDSIKSKIKDSEKSYEGHLKIAATNALSSMWLMPYVSEFLKEHPESKITLLSTDKQPDLTIREADVAIRPYLNDATNLVQDYIMTFHWHLYASPDYIERFGIPKNIDDLDNHRLLSFDKKSVHPFPNTNWHLVVGKEGRDARLPYFSTNSFHGLLQAAINGIGITPFPEEPDVLKQTNLQQVLPDIKGPAIDVYFSYPKSLQAFKLATAFGEFLKEKVRSRMIKK